MHVLNTMDFVKLFVGLFTPEHETLLPGQGGLVKTGKVYLLGVQALAVVVIATWSAIMSYISLKVRIISLKCNPKFVVQVIFSPKVEYL